MAGVLHGTGGMFIAHLPAGYLLSRGLGRWLPRNRNWTAVALLGSVFPDFDLFYFYLIDHHQHLHHSYWTHKPFYWLLITIGLLLLSWSLNSRSLRVFCAWFCSGVFLHLILDTWVGHIRWLSPLSERPFMLFEVPSRHAWWVWNYVMHWTFGAELAIVVVAAALLLAGRNARRRSAELAPVTAWEHSDRHPDPCSESDPRY